MSIKFNGAEISPSINNLQPTDFSQATVQPEFVLKGKKFYDETGQLREGTAALAAASGETFDAFWKCEATHITIPEGVTKLNPYVLYEQTSLESLDLPESLVAIEARSMDGCVNLTLWALPESVKTIGSQAFYNCYKLALKKLPDGITTIPTYCFQKCRSMPLKSLPSAIEVIDRNAFAGCSSLSVTRIPATVTRIGDKAFEDCGSLTFLTFEGTPTSIGTNVFNVCGNLKTINVPWAEGAVSGAPWGATNATINYNYTEPALIAFFHSCAVHGEQTVHTCVAEGGMTWEEWFESDYYAEYLEKCDTPLKNYNGYVYETAFGTVTINGEDVLVTDEIVEDHTYYVGG